VVIFGNKELVSTLRWVSILPAFIMILAHTVHNANLDTIYSTISVLGLTLFALISIKIAEFVRVVEVVVEPKELIVFYEKRYISDVTKLLLCNMTYNRS